MGLLVDGNTKLHKVALFDLPADITCVNNRLCRNTCYALKQQQYRHLYSIRMKRLEESRKSTFCDRIIQELQGRPICRPHSSGDFYLQAYVDKWTTIMRECPNTLFFAYTKTKGIFNFSDMESLPNVNIISSILPGGELNYNLPILLDILRDKYPTAHVCGATRPYIKGFCMGKCKVCLTEKMVLFEEH
jgi:hypothetical protein